MPTPLLIKARPVLDPSRDLPLTGKYNLTWALHPEATPKGARLHVGDEVKTRRRSRSTRRRSAGP